MKPGRFIFVVIAVMFLVGVRVDAALSLEARAAIEAMRARVSNPTTEVTQSISENDVAYVPGKELYAVLSKYRKQIYGNPGATEGSLAHWRVSTPEPAQADPARYQPGAMLEKALNNYRTQRNVFNLVKIMKAKEVAGRIDIEHEENAAGKKVLSVPQRSVAQVVTVSSSELLSQSKSALNEVSEHAVGSHKVNDKGVGLAKTADASVEPAAQNDNVEVQKYEFKMPSNYRITVD
ncbi:MAG: hypothetical protein CVV41_04750 [Candidatus Riflebacteria bacterium HGW-Riflebacteria-1]|nr:MAG: hypothetical protein CVV41_04750 [Candidatus Riflebacteria bacterium HGW-Riflebacteria-1]